MAVRNEYVFDFSEFHAHYQRTIISVGREIHEHIVVYQYLTARSVNFTLARLSAKIAIAEYGGDSLRRAATQNGNFHCYLSSFTF